MYLVMIYLFAVFVILLESTLFQEEQDIKALQAKNRKLGEALDQRQVNEFSYNSSHTLKSAQMYAPALRTDHVLAYWFAGD